MTTTTSRREFIRLTAASGLMLAGPAGASAQTTAGSDQQVPPGDRLQIATVGLGIQGLNDTRTAVAVNFVGHWVLGLPVGYILCFTFGMGVAGLWIGLSTGLIVCGVALTWYWHRRSTHYLLTGHRR